MKKITMYQCEICEETFHTESAAVRCENKHDIRAVKAVSAGECPGEYCLETMAELDKNGNTVAIYCPRCEEREVY